MAYIMKRQFIILSLLCSVAFANNWTVLYEKSGNCEHTLKQSCATGYVVMSDTTSCLEYGFINDKTQMAVKSYQLIGKDGKPVSCIIDNDGNIVPTSKNK